ncbi:hypothetical protein SCLCIDRAFT_1225458 [Scleroderma citrinum Foug A]|uniref:Uncharacterized protein n=1 Tax=Scleroderma citrinum Foug A TaxID=1036808 RepID=A0A0C3D1H5_9AGAM|nr:hypothetical protein SCLCIDRAFT_1225458 [Scleroderma citrinum Foug A]
MRRDSQQVKPCAPSSFSNVGVAMGRVLISVTDLTQLKRSSGPTEEQPNVDAAIHRECAESILDGAQSPTSLTSGLSSQDLKSLPGNAQVLQTVVDSLNMQKAI